ISVLFGKGDGTFKAASCFSTGGLSTRSVVISDVTGDSRPEVITTNYDSSSLSVLLNDGPYATSTNVTSNPNPSTYRQQITIRATVSSHSPVTPTGRVAFRYSAGGSSYTLGTVSLDVNGLAVLPKANLQAGTYPITAVYLGDAVNQPS